MTDQEYSKSFKATFGAESKAGDVALEILNGDERLQFCRMVESYYHHLSRCYSELACKLLYERGLETINKSKWKNFKINSYKKNALKTMYRYRVKYIDGYEAKMVKHNYWS